MAINAKDYLGTWIDNYADEDHGTIECIGVDTTTMIATFSNGRKISIIELDTSGQFTKPKPWFQAPEVAGNLGSMGYNPNKSLSEQAAPSNVLGDLSKIGHRKPEKQQAGYAHVEGTPVPDPTQGTQTSATISTDPVNVSTDPVASFIDSAIQISRNTGSRTTIPVTIPLEIDFDIINVIKMSMQIGASDIEILQHIMRYISVPESMIKKLIAEELMSPADAAIVNEHREETFEQTLKEELEKDYTNEIRENSNVSEIPDNEFHEMK